MKRTKFAAALAVLTLLTTLTGCGQAKEADGALEPVTLNEVAHSIFYAPQYAAIELGYFKDEGIALTLVNGAGADKVMTSLISGKYLCLPGRFRRLCCQFCPADPACRKLSRWTKCRTRLFLAGSERQKGAWRARGWNAGNGL